MASKYRRAASRAPVMGVAAAVAATVAAKSVSGRWGVGVSPAGSIGVGHMGTSIGVSGRVAVRVVGDRDLDSDTGRPARDDPAPLLV